MDGDIVLNIVEDNAEPATVKRSDYKKSGRWTDRVKAKRILKRKERPDESKPQRSNNAGEGIELRPSKKPRREFDRTDVPSSSAPSKHATQIISSLFSSNPAITIPKNSSAFHKTAKPSNAPISASSFEALGLSPLLISHLSTKMNITQPTSIQRAALSCLLRSSESRDAFIQSQTGSGKTLSFLLPIIQDLLPLSSLSYIDRSIGTLAIIIAPTRELAKQISDVLELILTLRLRPLSDDAGDPSPDLSSQRLTRWLVSGLLTGGATRGHEKARLRKGIPILVSTPGRLLDHLQNTSAFNVGKCRWLVLDEADRLMDLGFEETIRGILKNLDGRRKLAHQAEEEGKGTGVSGWDWKECRNVLCSATIREDVQKLAGVALNSPIVIKAHDTSMQKKITRSDDAFVNGEKFTPPAQLAQHFVVVPLKLRLVALVALLRRLLAKTGERAQKGTKIIVFLSCTDSVDFHWNVLGGTIMDMDEQEPSVSNENSDEDLESDNETLARRQDVQNPERIQVKSTLLPATHIYRLHGSLSLQTRLASLKAFSSKTGLSNGSSILLCTSVASRGLDLPLVRAVIQHDLPTEGGATEYVHRVGRTARVGRGGEAWAFVGPNEESWVQWVEERMGNGADKKVRLQNIGVETILREGFGGTGKEYEARATQVQLSFERWVLRSTSHAELARKGFVSHIRAYATHPLDEKHIFHVRNLHLGHLAKAFALREAPNVVGKAGKGTGAAHKQPRKGSVRQENRDDPPHKKGVEERMAAMVRSRGRLSKKGGVMMTSGASEFQIAGGDDLEKLVHR